MTVLFLDLVGFTELTSRLSAVAIVNLLNDIFQRFDGLLESTDVEKIKTIGDAYMCVGGLSGSSPKQSAERVALVALQMLRIIEDTERAERVQARIGMHSGPVVAGVIGGALIGYWLDRWFDTWPVLFLLFFFLGAAAGMLNAYRYIRKISDVPEEPKNG